MSYIYDFGISQDDAMVEHQALDIIDGDSLLCISSAGEVPLNLLALNDIRIKSVDISVNQNHLVKLKLAAVRALEPPEAAKFLGYYETTAQYRNQLYQKIVEYLDEEEELYWKINSLVIETGPIHAARFEKYIRKFNRIALRIIGKKNLFQLFEMNSTTEQESFFDQQINSFLLKKIFQITFHPSIYKNRGIATEGLIYSNQKNISAFFFNKFRDFCCSTPARKNYYLQFTFFNQVLFEEALPEYLTEQGTNRIKKNYKNIEIEISSYKEALEQSSKYEYNKFHLSNLGDWMEKDDFANLMNLISEKSAILSRINSRFIYFKHPIPKELTGYFIADDQLAEKLSKQDRYPFYGLAPIVIDKLLSN